MRNELEKDVADFLNHVTRLLSLVEQFSQADVDGEDLEHVPEHLSDEIFPSVFRNDVLRP